MVVSSRELDVAQAQVLESVNLDPGTRLSIIAALGGDSTTGGYHSRYPSVLAAALERVDGLDVKPPPSVANAHGKMPWNAGQAEAVTWSETARAAAEGAIGPLVPMSGDPLPPSVGLYGTNSGASKYVIVGGSAPTPERAHTWLWLFIGVFCAVATTAVATRLAGTDTVGWVIIGVCVLAFAAGWHGGALT